MSDDEIRDGIADGLTEAGVPAALVDGRYALADALLPVVRELIEVGQRCCYPLGDVCPEHH